MGYVRQPYLVLGRLRAFLDFSGQPTGALCPFLLILTHAHPSSPPKPARTSRTSLELFHLLRPTSSEAWPLLRRGWGKLRDVEGGLKAVSARTRKKGPALDEEVPFSGSEARRRWT
jgi:hypothetical protein